MNLGIIGTGRMGKKRAKAINQLNSATVKWICSRKKGRGLKFAEKYNIKKVITDWKKGVQDQDIQGVVITAPNHLHDIMAVKALSNDISVLIEYPLAINVKIAEKIIGAKRKSGGKLHVGLTHRLSARHLAVKDNLKKMGNTGSCTILQCSGKKISRWFDDKKKVGNVIIGSNYHYIDKLIDWFGEVKWVNADIYEELNSEQKNNGELTDKVNKDIGSVMLKFKKGLTAYIIYARGWPEPGLGFDCKIIGDKGYIVENNGQVERWSAEEKEELIYGEDNSILKDTELFIDLIRGGYKDYYNFEDGLYGVKVAEAAYRSAVVGERMLMS